MKLVVLFEPSLKTFVLQELSSYTKDCEELAPGIITAEGDYKTVNLRSAMAERIGIFLGLFKTMDDAKGADYKEYLTSSDSFKIKCDDKTFCNIIGQYVKDSTGAKVSLDNPTKTVFGRFLNDKWLVFLDTTGDKKLTLRGYASTSFETITSDAAAAIIAFSGWTADKSLIDLFCNQGYIVIEALLKVLNIYPGSLRLNNFSFKADIPSKREDVKPNIFAFSMSMNDIKNAKQNSQLAGVHKYIRFGSHDFNNIDLDLGENKFDYVISALPKNIDMNKLFFNLEYIIKKKGAAVLYTSADISSYKEYNIELVEETKIYNKSLYKFVVKK